MLNLNDGKEYAVKIVRTRDEETIQNVIKLTFLNNLDYDNNYQNNHRFIFIKVTISCVLYKLIDKKRIYPFKKTWAS